MAVNLSRSALLRCSMTLGSPFIGSSASPRSVPIRLYGCERQLLGGNRDGGGPLVLGLAGQRLGTGEGKASLGDDPADRAMADAALRPGAERAENAAGGHRS